MEHHEQQEGVRQEPHSGELAHTPDDLTLDTARLIAAHLHTGPTSALYNFAIDGGVRDRLFDELDDINRHRPYARTWVQALTRYCLAREDLGPLPDWRVTRGVAWSQASRLPAERGHDPKTNRLEAATPASGALDSEFMRSDLAVRLIDAAFAIGTAVYRKDLFASGSLVKALHRTRLAG